MTNNNQHYLVLAYYKFINVENPIQAVESHKIFFNNRDVTGRIYISEQGINGQMSGCLSDAEAYMHWLKSQTPFDDIHFKIHSHHENIFPRMTVKYRKQLVAIDIPVDVQKRGTHLSPQEWKQVLDSQDDYVLIDVRNDYEWEVGHFAGAELPQLQNFRDFPQYAESLKQTHGPEKKVLMYCTGGIRCELYSALLKEQGFEEVYQLQGGVINYGLEQGNEHWKGKLFVFDDRLAVPIDGQEAEPISHCRHCHLPCDTYYNCANMDCNDLFICCPSCIDVYAGCCKWECKSAERVRPYHKNGSHKPFRRRHLIKKE